MAILEDGEGELPAGVPLGHAFNRVPGGECGNPRSPDTLTNQSRAQRIGDPEPRGWWRRSIDALHLHDSFPDASGRRVDEDGVVGLE